MIRRQRQRGKLHSRVHKYLLFSRFRFLKHNFVVQSIRLPAFLREPHEVVMHAMRPIVPVENFRNQLFEFRLLQLDLDSLAPCKLVVRASVFFGGEGLGLRLQRGGFRGGEVAEGRQLEAVFDRRLFFFLGLAHALEDALAELGLFVWLLVFLLCGIERGCACRL